MPKIRRSSEPILDAITKTVVSQMLSKEAANTIYGRLKQLASTRGLASPALLDTNDLRSCGLSKNKCRTITEFSISYAEDTPRYQSWTALSAEGVVKEIEQHWGMSSWTANILAIFYYGHEDLFPVEDGSLKRAITKLCSLPGQPNTFDPSLAAPYRSYLALYLWAMLDSGRLD